MGKAKGLFSKIIILINLILIIRFSEMVFASNKLGIQIQPELILSYFAFFATSGGFMALIKTKKIKSEESENE